MKNFLGRDILGKMVLGMMMLLLFSACGKSSFSENHDVKAANLDFLPESYGGDGSDLNPEIDPKSDNQTPLPDNLPTTTTTTTTLKKEAQPPLPFPQPLAEYLEIILDSGTRLRTLKAGVLEVVTTLQIGDVIRIQKNLQKVNYNFINDQGVPEFSSTGFYPAVQVLKAAQISAEELKKLNSLETGLFITSVIISEAQLGNETTFKPLTSLAPGEAYLQFFEESGKPKSVWTAKSTERFPNINKGILYSSLSKADQMKWSAVMAELQRVANRTQRTPKDLLVIDTKLAKQYSEEYEDDGSVYGKGAWSIAVKATSVRHGFGDVPCAEFMSEIVRQAYYRAGYRHTSDFNSKKGNSLSVANDAPLVFNFSSYLAKAGWIPWDSQIYIPSMGAIVMHNYGWSPGHTYMSAGSNGRFVIDNGSPEGRDLRGASEKTIRDMFQTGVFFLPPGFTPDKWTDRN